MNTKGKHLILDMFDCKCKSALLNDKTMISKHALSSVSLSNNKVINAFSHQFTPQGVSIIVMLAESHLTVHTYPEEGYVSIDIYSCGKHASPENAINYLRNIYKPDWFKQCIITRGIKNRRELNVFKQTYQYDNALKDYKQIRGEEDENSTNDS